MNENNNENKHVHEWWDATTGCGFCGSYKRMCAGDVINPETKEVEACGAWQLLNSLDGIIKQERRSIPRDSVRNDPLYERRNI